MQVCIKKNIPLDPSLIVIPLLGRTATLLSRHPRLVPALVPVLPLVVVAAHHGDCLHPLKLHPPQVGQVPHLPSVTWIHLRDLTLRKCQL